ncbi:hypothetical protein OH76DRAFT_1206029 [Lentinus brumalis]|uniref:Uncharacterized protein n=1 Tax=Lentinus brumalis TaxID=2498619 RepID=A0A371CST1_9APHY|nr:hypothetical protein OH76DRAFT_1206029 [Polyporus brumalis]
MTAFPRACFGETELEGTRWCCAQCGGCDLPTVRQVKRHRASVLDACGSAPRLVKGKLGNYFSLADFTRLVQHELANPLVAPHMHWYCEDTGESGSETWQFSKWRYEVNGSLAGPMVRDDNGKDYFVDEPALAKVDGLGTIPVIPARWFTRSGTMYALAHILHVNHSRPDTFIVDARESIELPFVDFVVPYPELAADHVHYNLPHPSNVSTIVRRVQAGENIASPTPEVVHDINIPLPHPWRVLAQGKRVLTLPIWFYCDDTSGNVSKKWNKHNSLLFTLAGLPRDQAQLPYNIQFLGTSNIASPLEMFDEVVDVMREARRTGIEAYHCGYDEMVMLMPWVLAMAGDNPMQSEFCSHIGLTGKHFCRVCKVKGADLKTRPPGDLGEAQRLADFLSPGSPRCKADSIAALDEQLSLILGGAPSNAGPSATESGTKDKYFQHFADQLAAHCAKLKAQPGLLSRESLAEKLRELRATMPAELYSPCLRLEDFDPHSDTPVEILHVILLGFVKYFWRDAVSRQKSAGKDELITRLDSLDMSGLGVTRAKGSTLVHYAGSLTGRDFRVVLQVAPAVLNGLIPTAHYEAWLALCGLAPLVFQPSISDRSAYIVRLRDAIDNFLAATALWTTQWFNKPKFHILLHLLAHVERFGPAVLYSTETFESYNYVIRLRSIHSNHHAPSVDIAESFSHMHAVRHLVSGGYIVKGIDTEGRPILQRAGDGVRDWLHDPIFLRLMGMRSLFAASSYGKYSIIPFQTGSPPWSSTFASRVGEPMRPLGARSVIRQAQGVILKNNDVATVGSFVVYLPPHVQHDPDAAQLGRVEEIVVDTYSERVLAVLVARCDIGDHQAPYMFPTVLVTPHLDALRSLKDCLGVVSTFHNCARHACASANTQDRHQERVLIAAKGAIIQHREPSDLLLNLAQLRSSILLDRYRRTPHRPDLPRLALIQQAIRNRHVLDGTAETHAGDLLRPSTLTPCDAPVESAPSPTPDVLANNAPASEPSRMPLNSPDALVESLQGAASSSRLPSPPRNPAPGSSSLPEAPPMGSSESRSRGQKRAASSRGSSSRRGKAPRANTSNEPNPPGMLQWFNVTQESYSG